MICLPRQLWALTVIRHCSGDNHAPSGQAVCVIRHALFWRRASSLPPAHGDGQFTIAAGSICYPGVMTEVNDN